MFGTAKSVFGACYSQNFLPSECLCDKWLMGYVVILFLCSVLTVKLPIFLKISQYLPLCHQVGQLVPTEDVTTCQVLPV